MHQVDGQVGAPGAGSTPDALAGELCELGRRAGLDAVGIADATPFTTTRRHLEERRARGPADREGVGSLFKGRTRCLAKGDSDLTDAVIGKAMEVQIMNLDEFITRE